MALALAPTAGRADTTAPLVSSVPGVQLWLPNDERTEPFVEGNNEFVAHCDGIRRVHVAGLKQALACKAVASGDGNWRLVLAAGPQLPSPAMVSKAPLPHRVLPGPPTVAEAAALAAAVPPIGERLAHETKAAFLATYGGDPADYDRRMAEIQAATRYRALGRRQWRLDTPQGVRLVAPLGVLPDPMGWNLAMGVFRLADARATLVGSFDGCVLGFRDVNGDGAPDAYAESCANDEGRSHAFWSLAPEVRSLMSH